MSQENKLTRFVATSRATVDIIVANFDCSTTISENRILDYYGLLFHKNLLNQKKMRKTN